MNIDRTNKKEINNEGQGIKHGNEGWGIKTPQKNNQIRTCGTQSFHLAHQEPSVGSSTMWNSELFVFSQNQEIHQNIYLASPIPGEETSWYIQ